LIRRAGLTSPLRRGSAARFDFYSADDDIVVSAAGFMR
jgi:hypothetical protein